MDVQRYYSLTMEKNLLMILLLIICKAKKIINRRPHHSQSRGSVEAFNKYIQNALISGKDHQKDEFDLDEAVSDFFAIL